MPSTARQDLAEHLADFDELIRARDAICPDGAGRPAKRQGAAAIRGSVLLLAAAFESYVEDVFDLGIDKLFSEPRPNRNKQLKKNTSGTFSNANVFKVNMLFFNIGIPWIMYNPKLHWQKFTNKSVETTLNALILARNHIAHGKPYTVRKPTALKWRNFIERLADKIDNIVADHVEKTMRARPW